MAVNPDPRTLFLPDETAIPSFLSDKYAPIVACFLGTSAVFVLRTITRRPVLSGVQTYIMWGGLGGVLGKLGKDRYDRYNMERDAMLRHYIDLHPEDFTAPERVKVGDLLKPWQPIR